MSTRLGQNIRRAFDRSRATTRSGGWAGCAEVPSGVLLMLH
jgi:hypothetical protein